MLFQLMGVTFTCPTLAQNRLSAHSTSAPLTSMASAASLQFGERLVTSLLPTVLAQGSQLVLSPVSVWFALLLLLNGAGPSSPTYSELWSVVAGDAAQFTGESTPLAALNTQVAALRGALGRQATGGTTNLTIADALWTKGISLNPAYAGDMQRLFKAQAASVTGAAPINQWAANVTNGLIKQVMSANQPFDMVVTNAVYFKGKWLYPFAGFKTRTRNFTALSKGSPIQPKLVKVEMMEKLFDPVHNKNVSLAQVPGQYTAVRLPYKGSEGFTAVFVLPDASFNSIGEAAGSITGATVLDPKAWAPLSQDLKLSLPKFKVDTRLPLTQALQSMGMRAAFSPGADFSKAVQSPTFVTDVMQATVVEVNEEGTEAAAVTAVMFGAGPPQPALPLVFDRPFLFYVVETISQVVLFQGVITDPSSS